MNHIKEKDIRCCLERIRYGLYAIGNRMQYPYINYLMCTPEMDKKNIKDIYECFARNITLARITETISSLFSFSKLLKLIFLSSRYV